MRAEAAETGDVGLVAENSRSTQRLMLPPPALTASSVITKFRDIARLTGSAVSGAGPLAPGTPTLYSLPWGPSAMPVAWGRLVRLFGAGLRQFREGCRAPFSPLKAAGISS